MVTIWYLLTEPPNPEIITKICINYKNLKYLPKWIKKCIKLQHLECYNNEIVSLEELPQSLQELICNYTQIVSLEGLPHSLQRIKL